MRRCGVISAMRLLACGLLACGSAWCAEQAESAPADTSDWQCHLRPMAGIGIATAGRYTRGEDIPLGLAVHAGLRVLVSPDPAWGIGLETTWLDTGLDRDEGLRDALLAGPVAELRFWRVVHLSAGVLAAKELHDRQRTVIDVLTIAGFEPWPDQAWSPLLAYRSDVLTTASITAVRSITAGVRWSF